VKSKDKFRAYRLERLGSVDGLDIAEQLGAPRPWPKPGEHRRIGDLPKVVADGALLPTLPLPVAARVASEPS